MGWETELLDAAGRQALVNLVKGPALDGRRQAQLWATVVRQEGLLRSRLAELYLDLVISHDDKVAFCRPLGEEDEEPHPTLLRRVSLTYLQSALALFLRDLLAQAQTRGEDRVVVDLQEILDHLQVFRKPGDPDESKFTKAVQKAIDQFKNYSLLRTQEATPDRWEISPALRLIFSVDQVQALEQAYTQYQTTLGNADVDDDEEESE
jgi:hypothetical protein